jgi:hypothetical protein
MVVLLYTPMTRDQLATVATRKIIMQLRIPFVEVDGTQPESKLIRSAIWEAAGAKPGTYPIIYSGLTHFVAHGDSLLDLSVGSELVMALTGLAAVQVLQAQVAVLAAENAELKASFARHELSLIVHDGPESLATGDHEDEDSDAWTLAAWASSQPIGKAISQAITEASRESSQPESSEELLALLRSLACAEAGRTQLFTYLREGGVIEKLVSEMWPGLQQLATRSPPDANETHGSRFVQGQGSELSYGDLNVFFGGLEAIVGSPHPMVEEGMSREHCTSADSFVPFTTDNYLIQTTSQMEWWFVVDPAGALLSPEYLGSSYQALGLTPSSSYPVENAARLANGAKPRAPRALADFDAELCATNARLEEHHQTPCGREELVGARLYTGPMYMKVLLTASLSLPLSLSPSPSLPLSLSSPPLSHTCGPCLCLAVQCCSERAATGLCEGII